MLLRSNQVKGLLALLLICSAGRLDAQEWLIYAGPGLTCDGFLADRKISPEAEKSSFQPGAGLVLGGGYRTQQGFLLFLDGTFSMMAIQYPVPGKDRDSDFYTHFQARLMAGSGPAIPLRDEGSMLTPFLQLGGGYLTGWDGSANRSRNISVKERRSYWMVLCGAGLDWHFRAILPASLNLSMTYTPLPAFSEPVSYAVRTGSGTGDRQLQGRLLQLMLSCRVHLPAGAGHNR